jgi:hypothetical protein
MTGSSANHAVTLTAAKVRAVVVAALLVGFGLVVLGVVLDLVVLGVVLDLVVLGVVLDLVVLGVVLEKYRLRPARAVDRVLDRARYWSEFGRNDVNAFLARSAL